MGAYQQSNAQVQQVQQARAQAQQAQAQTAANTAAQYQYVPESYDYPAMQSSQKAASGSHAKKKSGFLHSLFSFIISLMVIIGAVFLIRTFVVMPYHVPSASMEQTIMTDDYVLSEKVSFKFGKPEAGQIVTFADPLDSSRTLIKRVVAVEGQTIDIKDGQVYIDGSALSEEYTKGLPTEELIASDAAPDDMEYPYTIPEGYVWCMGDNRTNSQDSRYFGPVAIDTITGHAFLIYWPFNHIQTL